MVWVIASLHRACKAHGDTVLVKEVPQFVSATLGRLHQIVEGLFPVSTAVHVTNFRPCHWTS